MSHRKLTDAERSERRRADRQQLERAARALLDSDGWQRWVRVRATNGLARYSFHNQLLIALQCPHASYVAGFRAFLKFNRCVCKGERAIRILAPMSARRGSTASDASEQEGEERKRTVFRAVAVFDVSQTESLPGTEVVPLEPPSEPITGDSHAHLVHPLARLAAELDFTLDHGLLDGSADGWCDLTNRPIVVNASLSRNAQVRVLVHELAHALGVGYREHGRSRAEVIVDTVTYVVCGSLGLDTSGSSIPYVAGWGEDGELEAIRSCARTIDEIARRIEDSVRVEDQREPGLERAA